MSDVKDNLTSDAFWLKTLYLVLFYLVSRLADIAVLVITVAQWGFQLATGAPNAQLAQFGDSLGQYVSQIIHYLSGVSEQKPYPFQDWPAPQDADSSE
ncbi:lipase [Bacterioplanes sanyensis]|uniref:Lipase n=1 Tax=Bacterioplanes sanyensis TaxID=1249553 RepID=A0A222FMY9_9GAMM|nr:DUF4389 domain-containing protein [Bacterioplanes sanyensis]ASP39741.1 lipase [Bacterioplanes sanyensis]